MTDFTALQVLKRARDLISDRDHWIQGYYACKLVSGSRFFGLKKPEYAPAAIGSIYSPTEADCFCLEGALREASRDLNWGHVGLHAARNALEIPTDGGYLVREPSEQMVTRFNDKSNHKQVLSVLDKAIERMEAQQ